MLSSLRRSFRPMISCGTVFTVSEYSEPSLKRSAEKPAASRVRRMLSTASCHQLLCALFEHVGAFQRGEVAAFMLEQRAAQGVFQGVDGAVYADVAGLQLGSGAGQVAGTHEGQEDFQLFEGELFVDQHGRGSCSNAADCARKTVRRRRNVIRPLHSYAQGGTLVSQRSTVTGGQ